MEREGLLNRAHHIIEGIVAEGAQDPLMQELLESEDPRLAAVFHLLTPSQRALEVGERISLSTIAEHVGASSDEEMSSILSPPLEANLLRIEKGDLVITKRGCGYLERLRELKQLALQNIPPETPE